MKTTQTFYFESQVLSIEAGYDLLGEVVPHLVGVHPNFKQWWLNPRSPKDTYVPFSDKRAAIKRLEEVKQKFEREFPGSGDEYNSILMTNAGTERQWRERGKVALRFRPADGVLQISVSNNAGTYDNLGQLLWSFLQAIGQALNLSFAQCGALQLVNGTLINYQIDRVVFPHRQFLGWMGYVPKTLTPEQVPAAYKLEPRGQGTVIWATRKLDLADPHAVKQVNQVEMSLADLDLLEITDPGLKPD